MNIQTYATVKCRDIIERAKALRTFDDLGDFPYDEIVVSDEGVPVRVVNTSAGNIPIVDILGLQRDQFATEYPSEEELDAYDRYVSMFTIIEGAEVLHQVRNTIAREQARMDLFKIDLPV